MISNKDKFHQEREIIKQKESDLRQGVERILNRTSKERELLQFAKEIKVELNLFLSQFDAGTMPKLEKLVNRAEELTK